MAESAPPAALHEKIAAKGADAFNSEEAKEKAESIQKNVEALAGGDVEAQARLEADLEEARKLAKDKLRGLAHDDEIKDELKKHAAEAADAAQAVLDVAAKDAEAAAREGALQLAAAMGMGALAEGDVVEANLKGEGTWYPAKITKKLEGEEGAKATYEIIYDDLTLGTEEGVAEEMIRKAGGAGGILAPIIAVFEDLYNQGKDLVNTTLDVLNDLKETVVQLKRLPEDVATVKKHTAKMEHKVNHLERQADRVLKVLEKIPARHAEPNEKVVRSPSPPPKAPLSLPMSPPEGPPAPKGTPAVPPPKEGPPAPKGTPAVPPPKAAHLMTAN